MRPRGTVPWLLLAAVLAAGKAVLGGVEAWGKPQDAAPASVAPPSPPQAHSRPPARPEAAAPAPAKPARKARAAVPSAAPWLAPDPYCTPEAAERLERRRERLRKREEALELRERRLWEAEAAAKTLATQLEARLAALDEKLAEMKKLRDKRIKRLATVYASMKPKAAAAVIARLDLDTAVKVLSIMEEKRVGKILTELPPEVVVRITRGLARAAR